MKIKCLLTNLEFDSIAELAKHFGIKRTTAYARLNTCNAHYHSLRGNYIIVSKNAIKFHTPSTLPYLECIVRCRDKPTFPVKIFTKISDFKD